MAASLPLLVKFSVNSRDEDFSRGDVRGKNREVWVVDNARQDHTSEQWQSRRRREVTRRRISREYERISSDMYYWCGDTIVPFVPPADETQTAFQQRCVATVFFRLCTKRGFIVPGTILSTARVRKISRDETLARSTDRRKGQRVTGNNYKSAALCTVGRMRKERQVSGIGGTGEYTLEGDAAFFH